MEGRRWKPPHIETFDFQKVTKWVYRQIVMKASDPVNLATVSSQFLEDWLDALKPICFEEQLGSFLARSGLSIREQSGGRVTLDQIVRLYQIAAVETEDEMMGLWSRPIRARALQHLLTTVREASSLPSALFRFVTFWNLLLDDYRFELVDERQQVRLVLRLRGEQSGHLTPQRFGHMLILKLCHGLLSWLAGHEVPVEAVQFAFEEPGFAEDYSVIFPAPVVFGAASSSITFAVDRLGPAKPRSNAELNLFLERAPRDWLFTSFHEHKQSLRVRDFLYRSGWEHCRLSDAAHEMRMTPRTLIRRLEDDGTSFQAIKDGLRRDIAIRALRDGSKSIEQISQDVGFSSAANFHRAFRRWTGTTPSIYRDSN